MKKRSTVPSDAEDLSFHLSSIRDCLLRVRDNAEAVPKLLRSCLHMYNALENGLNYMDDPEKNIPEVRATQECVELVLMQEEAAASRRTQPDGGDDAAAFHHHLPIHMLLNTLGVLMEEMKAPRDPIMPQERKKRF
jgi:hypothetical protein